MQKAQKIMRIVRILDSFNAIVAKISIAFLWILTILIFVLAIALNFSYSNSKLDDFSFYCFAAMVLFALSYTLREDKHVRLDLIYARYSKRTKTISWCIVNFLFVLPFCFVIMRYGFDFALQSYRMSESSPNGRIPYYFIFKSLIVAGFFLLAMQSFSEGLKAFLAILKGTNLEEKDAYTQEVAEIREILRN